LLKADEYQDQLNQGEPFEVIVVILFCLKESATQQGLRTGSQVRYNSPPASAGHEKFN
jgi:hypothetical protein